MSCRSGVDKGHWQFTTVPHCDGGWLVEMGEWDTQLLKPLGNPRFVMLIRSTTPPRQNNKPFKRPFKTSVRNLVSL